MLGSRITRLLAAALAVSVGLTWGTAVDSAASTTAPPTHQWEADRLVIEPLAGVLSANGDAYRGRFELRVEGGSIRLVNDVHVEDYVRGIREMPPSWPIEAQRAQAIAARSYALHQAAVARKEGRPSDLCATAACQVYGGLLAEQRGGAAWKRAVESTSSQVVAYKGTPILAMYSSSNGGQIAAASKPYLRSAPDPDDAASPHHRWRVEVPESAIGAAVALPEGAELTGVARQGSVVVASWEGPQPDAPETERPMPVAEFRKRLEAAHPPPPGLPRLLPSTAFGLQPGSSPGQVVIEGRGWGHGVGMSQFGALGKARRGMSAAQILGAYYAGLTPVQAAPGQIPETVRVDIASGQAFDIGGESAFRVVADGAPVATGSGPAAWKVGVRKGRIVLTAPAGWAPPQPQAPPSGTDPFQAADQPVSPLQLAAPPVSRPPSGAVSNAWRALALALVLSVGTAAGLLRHRADLAPLSRG